MEIKHRTTESQEISLSERTSNLDVGAHLVSAALCTESVVLMDADGVDVANAADAAAGDPNEQLIRTIRTLGCRLEIGRLEVGT